MPSLATPPRPMDPPRSQKHNPAEIHSREAASRRKTDLKCLARPADRSHHRPYHHRQSIVLTFGNKPQLIHSACLSGWSRSTAVAGSSKAGRTTRTIGSVGPVYSYPRHLLVVPTTASTNSDMTQIAPHTCTLRLRTPFIKNWLLMPYAKYGTQIFFLCLKHELSWNF